MHANYWPLWALHRHSLFLHAQVPSWPGHDSCAGGILYRLGVRRLRCASASSQQIWESGAQCHRWLHWPKIWGEQLSCHHTHSACATNQKLLQTSMRLGSEGGFGYRDVCPTRSNDSAKMYKRLCQRLATRTDGHPSRGFDSGLGEYFSIQWSGLGPWGAHFQVNLGEHVDTIMFWDTLPNKLSYFSSYILSWVNISIYVQLINILL
jgi:hypothetical protein